MRQLTFKGFLRQYVRELSALNTSDIKRLADEVPNNYRLAEPLVLYALATNKHGRLKKVARDEHLKKVTLSIPDNMTWDEVVRRFEDNDESVGREFRKAYNSFIVVRNKHKSKNHTKMLMLNRARQIQKEKGVSTYRIYTDLKLNHGNVNDYFKNGDVSKVSLEVAERVLAYLEHK